MASGLPSLLNQANAAANIGILLTADAIQAGQFFGPPIWGVYQNGELALEPDSIIAVDFRRDWRVADAPQENGAFQSYNKVSTPYDLQVSMTKGGNDAERQAFLANVRSVSESIGLLTVMTPDETYSNLNIDHVDYSRSARSGVTLLTVNLYLVQIRIPPDPAFTNTKQPSGASPTQVGQVQPQQTAQGFAVGTT